MTRKNYISFLNPLIITFIFSINLNAQQGVSTIGMQVKPILPINYFGAGPVSVSFEDTASIEISSKLGYCFGMIVRHGITKNISIETGINYTRRNYNLIGSSNFENASDKGDFGFVSYELPLQGLIYIRLGESLFMNASAGFGINFYASDVASVGENDYINHYSEHARWINASMLSNLGLEYRTKLSGYFYLGASLNIPLNEITVTYLKYYYENNSYKEFDPINLNGNYFTLDIRYFFPQTSDKKKN